MLITITMDVKVEEGRTEKEVALSYCKFFIDNDIATMAAPNVDARGMCKHNRTCPLLADICLPCRRRSLI